MEINNSLIQNLKKRNFEVHICKNKEEANEKILDLIKESSKISWGGSQTLEQIGLKKSIYESKDKKNYIIYDRSEAKTPEEVRKVFLDSFDCDYYLTSANALMQDGRIVNIDGRGNRVAATIYGPSKVIFVIGKNKIVDGNLDNAILRVKNEASPPNVKRLDKKTGCYFEGKCTDCSSLDRICRSIGIIEWGKYNEDKIVVILIDQNLGY